MVDEPAVTEQDAAAWVAGLGDVAAKFAADRQRAPPFVYVTLVDGERFIAVWSRTGPGEGFITFDATDPDIVKAETQRVRVDVPIPHDPNGGTYPKWFTPRAVIVRFSAVAKVELVHLDPEDVPTAAVVQPGWLARLGHRLAKDTTPSPSKVTKRRTTTFGVGVNTGIAALSWRTETERQTEDP